MRESKADSPMSVESDMGLGLMTLKPRAGCLTVPRRCPGITFILKILRLDSIRMDCEGQELRRLV